MLPIVDNEVQAANVRFEALYRDLCTNKVNQDGSSIGDIKAQASLDEDLRRVRTAAAKRNAVTEALAAVACGDPALPDEIHELVAIIAASLDIRTASSDGILLRDDIDKFKANLPQIASAISTQINQDATTLTTLLPTSSTPSTIPSLPAQITTLQSALTNHTTTLSTTRQSLATTARTLHATHATALEQATRVLEQTLHGAAARAARARVDYLATVAEGMERKLEVQRRGIWSGAAASADGGNGGKLGEAVERRTREAEGEIAGLRRKAREVERVLEEYGARNGARELVEEVVRIRGEAERVRGEIERLKR